MHYKIIKPATGAEREQPVKKVDSNGNKFPECILEGEILQDITMNQWKLGKSIGTGGFGEIYLASNNINETVGLDAQYVVKVEPHENGTLFVEINCYLRMARSAMIDEWKRSRMLKHVGLSRYIGSGSHVYGGNKYRFLVLDRHGQDIDKLFVQSGKFSLKTVCYLGIQILDALEYIHSHGFVHADIKGQNLLLGNRKGTENCVYLLDFGIGCRYLDGNGVHKKYVYDQRKAHAGTLEYTSRDAHAGAFSRRGDLEILGYNMLQWLCGTQPWNNSEDPENKHSQKETLMSNIPLLMRRSFLNLEPPATLIQYLKYVASLTFETKPSYAYCRNLLRQGVENSGCVDDGKLVFGNSPLGRTTETNNRGNKRRATEYPENTAELQPKKRIYNTRQQSCVTNRMIREKIILGNAKKKIKKHAKLNHKLPNIIPAKYEPVVLIRRLPNEVIQKFTASLTQVSKSIKHWQQEAKTSSFSKPTPAMSKILSKMKQKASTPTASQGTKHKGRKSIKHWQQEAKTSSFSKPTPAMSKILPKMRQKASTPAAYQGKKHKGRRRGPGLKG
jgi:vaccinia related kinase